MSDPRDEIAALNNAEWCAAVWKSHGLVVGVACGLWFTVEPTPEYYPNVVTVDRTVSSVDQAAFIAELTRATSDPAFSVKDSFANLDLRSAEHSILFEASWIWNDDRVPLSGETAILSWQQIEEARDLACWEDAWKRGSPATRAIFLPELLDDRRATVLAGVDEANIIRAGGIAYEAGGAIGITNVFGSLEQLKDAIASLLPELPLVGYEHGDDLAVAKAAGFEVIGPLRIWTRTPPP